MNLHELLLLHRAGVVDEALQGLTRSALPHYDAQEPVRNRGRLERLYDAALRCLAELSLAPIAEHARAIARARHRDGFDLHEVHCAFNALEEAIWRRIAAELPLPQQVQALGQASTVLGAGKEALALEYVRLAGHHEPDASLDLTELFKGTG